MFIFAEDWLTVQIQGFIKLYIKISAPNLSLQVQFISPQLSRLLLGA